MINEETIKELNLNEAQVKKLNEIFDKVGQSEADKVRTEYSAKLKTAEEQIKSLTPAQKSETEKALEQAQAELSSLKFKNSLKDAGVPDALTPFIKSDADVTKITEALKAFHPVTTNTYIPTNNNAGSGGITKEQFKKLSIDERTKIYNESPELYAQLKS